MQKSLVIVESPAKAHTINRYLGNDYVVKASMGHVRDLPKSTLGVDVSHDFAPIMSSSPTAKRRGRTPQGGQRGGGRHPRRRPGP